MRAMNKLFIKALFAVTKDVVLMLVLFLFVMPVILSGGVYVWYKHLGGSDQVVMWKRNR